MTEQEFERLTGVEVTPDQYEVVNGMYMCDDNQTKQEFCRGFMEMGLMAHVNYVVRLKGECEALLREKAEAGAQRDLWRGEYLAARERAAALEAKLGATAGMVKGGAA